MRRRVTTFLLLFLAGYVISYQPNTRDPLSRAELVAERVEGRVLVVRDDVAVILTPLVAAEALAALEATSLPEGPVVEFRVETADGTNLYLVTRDGGLAVRVQSGRDRGGITPVRVGEVAASAVTQAGIRDGCTFSSNGSGSRMACYSDGRLSYESVCTLGADFRLTCRSESF